MSIKEFKLHTIDGKDLYGKTWLPSDPIAVVCLVHGLGEHIGRYEHLAGHFNRSGIAVYGVDQRGHGHNAGTRGHARCQQLWEDLESLMKFVRVNHLNAPMFLYGHSWGGNIVSNLLLRKDLQEIRGVVLSAPWLKLSFEPTRMQLLIARGMSKIIPSLTQPNGLKPEYLSRDLSIGEAYLNDPLVHNKISAGLFNEAVKNGEYVLLHAHQLSKPVLIFHGTDDNITSLSASQTFAAAAPELVSYKWWPEMRHETHNEIGKEQVMDFTAQWILEKAV
ncbi:MAG: lysophospholipase [Cyclobacteriaceae bacterium]|nr:MAG: lysophospholipase [Cyclobacteriaceae bacterium]